MAAQVRILEALHRALVREPGKIMGIEDHIQEALDRSFEGTFLRPRPAAIGFPRCGSARVEHGVRSRRQKPGSWRRRRAGDRSRVGPHAKCACRALLRVQNPEGKCVAERQRYEAKVVHRDKMACDRRGKGGRPKKTASGRRAPHRSGTLGVRHKCTSRRVIVAPNFQAGKLHDLGGQHMGPTAVHADVDRLAA